MRKAVRWIVPALVLTVVAAVALIIIGATTAGSKHKSSHTTSAPAAAAPAKRTETTAAPRRLKPRKPASAVAVPRSGRCGEISVNEHTSCAFARVVVREYDAHPSASFLARSPVTGLTYTMHCEAAHGAVTCNDNSTSTLAFNGPPP